MNMGDLISRIRQAQKLRSAEQHAAEVAYVPAAGGGKLPQPACKRAECTSPQYCRWYGAQCADDMPVQFAGEEPEWPFPPKLKVKRLHPDAQIPRYMTAGAACFDLAASEDGRPHANDVHAWIFPTGLALEVPAGHAMLIFSRSGQGFGDAVRLSNCVGVIDSDYRGEVFVSLRADGDQPRRHYAGDRIAQAMLVPVQQWDLVEVDQLSDTARGDGAYGSTGR